jgi:hypothetical protein
MNVGRSFFGGKPKEEKTFFKRRYEPSARPNPKPNNQVIGEWGNFL